MGSMRVPPLITFLYWIPPAETVWVLINILSPVSNVPLISDNEFCVVFGITTVPSDLIRYKTWIAEAFIFSAGHPEIESQ